MSTPLQYRSVGRRSRLGLTLVELTVSIMVLTFAICAATSTVITTGALNQDSHETEIARRAPENEIEVLRNANFLTVFATYDAARATIRTEPAPLRGTCSPYRG